MGSVLQHDGQHVTLLGMLSVHGRHAVMTVDDATATKVFRASIKHVRSPTLTPGDMVGVDHLRAHKALGTRGSSAVLAPYAPDPSPVESCRSKVKAALRTVKARTWAALDTAITGALDTITASDAQGWFRHGGSAL
ncbi:MAG TPA: transposase [Alphaproteobacteria bacterium]|nr:transposase [Alphaproteobacteria bacterium]